MPKLAAKARWGLDVDFFDYDLVCVGAPSHSWHPTEPMASVLKSKFIIYRKEGIIKPGDPRVSGRNALISSLSLDLTRY